MPDTVSSNDVPLVNGDVKTNKYIKYSGDIVISGIGVRVPNSNNMTEFRDNLFNKLDMVLPNNERWPMGINGVPDSNGLIKDVKKFDAEYFGVNKKLANTMDPQLRKLLETTYEAITDAGIPVEALAGTRTAVYVGTNSSETLEYSLVDPDLVTPEVTIGCQKYMFSNYLSFAFDFKGPSATIESACSSSVVALDEAVSAIRTGQCDSAIVGGCNLLLRAAVTSLYNKGGLLSKDGRCKAFDESGDGFGRSDAIVSLLVQKKPEAKRVYTTIAGISNNCDGYTEEGLTYPSWVAQLQLMKDVCRQAKVNPLDVVYIEAHGPGTAVGDPQEIRALTDNYCVDRPEPLLVGSVKSNMGHAEGASGLCAIAKVIISMEEEVIPPNLHFVKPNPNIPALVEGKVKIVTEMLPWKPDLVALSNFGFGGSNAHVLLHPNYKLKSTSKPAVLPVLVPFSGRTSEGVESSLEQIIKHFTNPDYVGLLHEVSKLKTPGNNYRGYLVASDKYVTKEVGNVDNKTKPLWLVLSGSLPEYKCVGNSLKNFKVFENLLIATSAVLSPLGINVNECLDNEKKTIKDPVKSHVYTTIIQLAILDILSSVNIIPDGVIGSSLGEICCAYADGVITSRQAVLITYWIAKTLQALPTVAIAEIVAGEDQIRPILPKDITITHNNGNNSITICGSESSMKKFLDVLKKKSISAQDYKNQLPLHTVAVKKAEKKLIEQLKKVIPDPKPVTGKWLSTSILESSSKTSKLSQLASAEYFVNNVLSPVLFQQFSSQIPVDATIVSTNKSLHSILSQERTQSSIIDFESEDANVLLKSIGKLYLSGLNPDISKLYEPIEFPVPRGTPMISPLIKWNHATDWRVTDHWTMEKSKLRETVFDIDLNEEDFEYLSGYGFAGKNYFPAAGSLYLVWRVFAKNHHKQPSGMPVVFENVHFVRNPEMSTDNKVTMVVYILEGLGEFEVLESGTLVAKGRVWSPENIEKEMWDTSSQPVAPNNDKYLPLNQNDIYKELNLLGFKYEGNNYKGLVEVHNNDSTGKVQWKSNWVAFIDSVLQLFTLKHDISELGLVRHLQKVVIDPAVHLAHAKECGEEGIPVTFHKYTNMIKSKGVEIRAFKYQKPFNSTKQNQQILLLPKKNVDHAYIRAQNPDDFDTIEWVEDSHLQGGYQVTYIGLNLQDSTINNNKYNWDILSNNMNVEDRGIILDFAGIGNKNQKVMGIVKDDGISNKVVPKPDHIWDVPSNWSLEEAATVPVAYNMAYYCLLTKGKLEKSHSVLIHEGYSPIGYAAISIAYHMGCAVYVTTESPEQKEFLMEQFPKLKDSNFSSCIDDEFRDHILVQTNGKGVRFILHTLPEELFQASSNSIQIHGRIVFIRKHNAPYHKTFGTRFLLKNTTLYGTTLEAMYRQVGPLKETTDKFFMEGIKSGAVKPIPHKLFNIQKDTKEIQQAIKLLHSSSHQGKVVLKIQEDDDKNKTLLALPRTYFSTDKVYIVIGNLNSDFDTELITWMIGRGAKTIMFVTSCGIINGFQSLHVRRWQEEKDLKFIISTTDIYDTQKSKEVFDDAAKLGKIGGVFNLDLLSSQSHGKVLPGIRNIDSILRKHKSDYFVVFFDSEHQNDIKSNLEHIVKERNAIGLPVLIAELNTTNEMAGNLATYISTLLNNLDVAMQTPGLTNGC